MNSGAFPDDSVNRSVLRRRPPGESLAPSLDVQTNMGSTVWEGGGLRLPEKTFCVLTLCAVFLCVTRNIFCLLKGTLLPFALSFVSLETKSYCRMVVHNSLIFPRDGRYLYLPLALPSLNYVI